jgi:hypothetical protein
MNLGEQFQASFTLAVNSKQEPERVQQSRAADEVPVPHPGHYIAVT